MFHKVRKVVYTFFFFKTLFFSSIIRRKTTTMKRAKNSNLRKFSYPPYHNILNLINKTKPIGKFWQKQAFKKRVPCVVKVSCTILRRQHGNNFLRTIRLVNIFCRNYKIK